MLHWLWLNYIAPRWWTLHQHCCQMTEIRLPPTAMNCIQAIYQITLIVHCCDKIISTKTFRMTTCLTVWSCQWKKKQKKNTFTYAIKKILKADRVKLDRMAMLDRIFWMYISDVCHMFTWERTQNKWSERSVEAHVTCRSLANQISLLLGWG